MLIYEKIIVTDAILYLHKNNHPANLMTCRVIDHIHNTMNISSVDITFIQYLLLNEHYIS